MINVITNGMDVSYFQGASGYSAEYILVSPLL